MIISIEIDDQKQLPREYWGVLVKFRASWKCEECGAEPVPNKLQAHHVNEDPNDNRLVNGMALCGVCHVKKHDHNNPRFKGQKHSAEAKAIIAEQSRQRWSDPEYAARMRKAMTGAKARKKEAAI